MNDCELAFLWSPELERLSYPPDCPFNTRRAAMTRQRLLSFGWLGGEGRCQVTSRKATLAELEEFHTPRYLEEIRRAARGDLTPTGFQMGFGGPDTPVFPDMFEYGAWACGGALLAADLLGAGEADVVFNLWGGFHHAHPEQAGGFCYLNDVVLACLYLAEAGKRVAYVDVDAHHADGVQAAFYDRSDVLTISLHESGRTLFPWGGFEEEIGHGAGAGYNVNVPLPVGTYDEAFLHAYDQTAAPLLRAFRPDVIVLELGLDALAGDPLTHLRLTNNALVAVIASLLGCHRPVLVAGGGGYHLEHAVRGWTLAWGAFGGEDEGWDASAGLGGVLLGTGEWAGGLRDPVLPVTDEQRASVEPCLCTTIQAVRNQIFPYHGLALDSAAAEVGAAACAAGGEKGDV